MDGYHFNRRTSARPFFCVTRSQGDSENIFTTNRIHEDIINAGQDQINNTRNRPAALTNQQPTNTTEVPSVKLLEMTRSNCIIFEQNSQDQNVD